MILLTLLIPFIEILLYIFLFHGKCLSNFDVLSFSIYRDYWNEYLLLLMLTIFLYKRNKLLNYLLIILFFLVFMVDITQILSYYYTDFFITLDALQNLDQVLLFLNFKIVVLLLFVFFLYFLCIYTIDKTNYSYRYRYLFIILILTVINFLFYKIGINKYQGSLYNTCRIEKGPIIVLSKTLSFYFNTKKNLVVDKLSDDDCQIGKKLNLLDNECKIQKNQEFYTKNKKSFNLEKPNVIIIFIESLSAKYINYYNKKLTYSTPNIDNFANKSLVFQNYINSGFPTLYGLYSQLCSTYPSGVDNANINVFLKSFKDILPNQCLPQYFNQYEYDTIYMNHGGENRKNMKEIMKYIGFEKIFFNEQIKPILKQDATHKINLDYSDKQMMEFLVKFLREKHSDKKPFFISLSTIGTHVGVETSSKDQNLQDLSMPEVQYKALDNAMEIFFDYFFNSEYSKNTIVIFTGDHIRPSYNEKYNSSKFDDLALMIYIPGIQHNNLTVNASSVALAPTIMQIVNYPNQQNTFIGKSLFEKNEDIAIGVTSDDAICYNFKENSKCKNISIKTLNKIAKYIFLRSNE